jgi:uncharacterized protein (TIGR02421 family)
LEVRPTFISRRPECRLSSSDTYRETIRSLSDRLVAAQAPVRILDAIKWDESVERNFFEQGARELPAVDAAYYESRPLGFDPAAKRQEFSELERDVKRHLGDFNPIGGIMRRMCREYRTVVDMLAARGTPEFSILSANLYGSAHDAFSAGEPTLADFGEMLSASLSNIDRESVVTDEPRNIPACDAVALLQERLDQAFPNPEKTLRVKLSDGIVADAAAGSDYIKLRQDACFNERDLRLLEVHEGWVHLGTTLNGLQQPVCTFLGKGPPSSTVTQEGLAVLMETMTFASFPGRMLRITARIHGIAMAENGANFLEVYEFFLDWGFNPHEAFVYAARVFRGSSPTDGPFTKDISYSKGFVLTYNFISLVVQKGLLDRIPLLFVGKTTLKDMRTLAQGVEDGIITPPRYLPPPFVDLNALSAWICSSNFLRRLDLARIEADYANLI